MKWDILVNKLNNLSLEIHFQCIMMYISSNLTSLYFFFLEKWPKKQRFKVTKNFWAWNVCQCQFFWGVMVFVGERVRATCKQKHFTEFARDLSRPNWKARTWLVSVIVIHNWYVSQADTFLATHEWNNKCVLDIETKHCRCKIKDLLLVFVCG